MKPVLIFGAGQVAQVFHGYLRRNGIPVAAHVVDRDYLNEAHIGTPMVTLDDVTKHYPPDTNRFLIGMSFKGVNKLRAEKYQTMLGMGYEPGYFRHQMCGLGDAVVTGRGSFIMDLNILQDMVQIGENCVMFPHNHVGHHSRIGQHVWISSGVTISGSVEIGDHCFIGSGATIRDNVKIGPRCVIGAGALILKDCEADGVYGVPGTPRSPVPSNRLRSI